jgi:MFS family permease
MATAAMEATVVATAMPTVVGSLGGLELYGWVGAIYLLASTVTIPLNGKLADVYGRKPVMLAGIFVFLLGSMLSGMSRTMVQLIAFRGVQGVGAGALQPIALTIIGDLYTPRERARIQGLFGAVWGVAAMVGPFLGGLIVRALSWRWVFYINLPFGAISAGLLVLSLREKIERKEHRFDVLGALTLSGAILALLLAAGRIAPALLFSVSIALLAAFVWVERRAPEPILPLSLLARPVIAVATLGGAILGAVMMGTLMFVPLFVQALLHGTPTEAGSTVGPMLVGWPIAATAGGRLLAKTGFRPIVRSGFIVVTASAVVLWWMLRPGASVWALRIAMTGLGAGLGLANTALLIAVQDSVDWSQRGVATATTMFSRSIGSAIAVGGLGALLAAAIGPSASSAEVERLLNPRITGGLDAAAVERLAGGLEHGLANVFLVVAVLAGVGLIVGMMFPRSKLRTAAPSDPRATVVDAS